MPTGIGLLFLAVGLYFAIRKSDQLFPLLLFSAIFPATSAITFGRLWIMPYYLLAPIFVIAQFRRSIDRRSPFSFAAKPFFMAFGCLGITSSFILPLLFSGIPVYSPRLGTSDLAFTTFPLVFSVGNVAQAGYLMVNVLVVFAAASARETGKVWRWLNATFYCLTGTIFVELGCLLSGTPFPYLIIENTPERSFVESRIIDPSQRLQGTCGEPSFAGLILVIFVAAYFYRYYTGKGNGWKVLIGVFSIFLVRSSSALVAMTIVCLAIVVTNPPVRFPVVLRMRRFSKLIPVIVVATVCICSSAFMSLFREWILDKPNSGSYAIRTTSDRYSLDLLIRTYGFGVGIGSYRPSSLIASLVGTVGVVGVLIFGMLILQISLSVSSERSWLRWSLWAGLIDMSLGVPDITHPILWSLLAVVVFAGVAKQQRGQVVQSPEPLLL